MIPSGEGAGFSDTIQTNFTNLKLNSAGKGINADELLHGLERWIDGYTPIFTLPW